MNRDPNTDYGVSTEDSNVQGHVPLGHEAQIKSLLEPCTFAINGIHWPPIAELTWSTARSLRNHRDDRAGVATSPEHLVMRALSLPGRFQHHAQEGEARVLSGRALMAGLLLVGFDVLLNIQRGEARRSVAYEDVDTTSEVLAADANDVDALYPQLAFDQIEAAAKSAALDIEGGERPAVQLARSDARIDVVDKVYEPFEPAASLVRQSQAAPIPLLYEERRPDKTNAPLPERNPDRPAGPQFLIGTDGDDVLIGNDGDDVLIGGAGDDQLSGGEGDDQLAGDQGDDLLEGDAGDDRLDGGDGDDDLNGGEGNDQLDGGEGADRMAGGSGDDGYTVDDADDIVIEFESGGHDTVVTTLEVLALTDAVEVLRYVGEANFTGYGNAGDNVICGADGDDELYGESDEVFEPAVGTPGALAAEPPIVETLAGPVQPALDVAYIDTATAALVEILGDTQEPIVFLEAADAQETATTPASHASPTPPEVETLVVGSKNNDTIVGQHGSNDTIFGGKGNDRITGGAGDDILSGGEGRDTFFFRPGFGSDVITDFSTVSGDHDTIVLSGLFADEAELDAHMTQVGSDVVISVSPSDQIVLTNVEKLTISVHDQFIFA